MSEHTPGPWRIDAPPIQQAGRAITAYYEGEAWKDDAVTFTMHSVANARLIAAAPKMLAALQRVEWQGSGPKDADEFYCPLCKAHSKDSATIRHADTCLLFNAIAEATGNE